ncbi:MAG TPA: hypothetical protein VGL03_01640 [Thermoanaerobaculia bacterium]|jgi:hypothetical protein
MDANDRGARGVAAEPDEVPTRTVVGFAILLTILTAVAMAMVAGLFFLLEHRAEKKDDVSVAAAGLERRVERLPPPPRLQVSSARYWQDFRAAEQERLSTYGWMDRSTGAVHIPIDRAMDLIAERGIGPLPVAPVVMPAPAPTAVPPAKPGKKP